LARPWPSLLATGIVGGMDLGLGVLALLLVRQSTHSSLLAAVALGVGFLGLTLADSELFTENFLLPVVAVVSRRSPPASILRLWGGTMVANFLGGWVFMALVVVAVPFLRPTAVEVGRHYPQLGVGATSFAGALLGGAVLTVMTWMERGTDSVPAKLLAAGATAFLLAAAPLNHAVVSSLEMFAALQAGAPYGYLDWLGAMAWAAVGNLVGGLGLVTVLRLIQAEPPAVRQVQRDSSD
jgi:formate/nitrite transporter FocA (FNT family)